MCVCVCVCVCVCKYVRTCVYVSVRVCDIYTVVVSIIISHEENICTYKLYISKFLNVE